MTTQLSQRETEFLKHLQAANVGGCWGLPIREVLKEPTLYKVRTLISGLLSQARDNRREMVKTLGFDIAKLLNVKFFDANDINAQLCEMGYVYRAIKEIMSTNYDALWCAQAGFFNFRDCAAVVYVDSNLERYIKLGNGQIFHCSNTDLLAMPELDQANIKAYLTGLID